MLDGSIKGLSQRLEKSWFTPMHKFMLWTEMQFYPLLECFNLKGSECSGAKRKGLGVPWGRPASLQTSFQREFNFKKLETTLGGKIHFSSSSKTFRSTSKN